MTFNRNNYKSAEIGRKMYQLYCKNQIQKEEEFLIKLEEVRSECNR